MRELKLNCIYRHFKGHYYLVKEIALDSENLEEFVIYQALYGDNKTYIRSLKMFLESIDEKRADNITKQKYRFELVNFDREELK
jgi:hypothetical protein